MKIDWTGRQVGIASVGFIVTGVLGAWLAQTSMPALAITSAVALILVAGVQLAGRRGERADKHGRRSERQ